MDIRLLFIRSKEAFLFMQSGYRKKIVIGKTPKCIIIYIGILGGDWGHLTPLVPLARLLLYVVRYVEEQRGNVMSPNLFSILIVK